MAAQREAQGHALAGDLHACLHALERARTLLARQDGGSEEPVNGTMHHAGLHQQRRQRLRFLNGLSDLRVPRFRLPLRETEVTGNVGGTEARAAATTSAANYVRGPNQAGP
ncbi:hypothetical protein ACWD1Y_43060 [Streptomyces sp. NPDC002814]